MGSITRLIHPSVSAPLYVHYEYVYSRHVKLTNGSKVIDFNRNYLKGSYSPNHQMKAITLFTFTFKIDEPRVHKQTAQKQSACKNSVYHTTALYEIFEIPI